MITYKSGGLDLFRIIFKSEGSVFPQAACVAVPCALLTAALRLCMLYGVLQNPGRESFLGSVLSNSNAWNGVSVLVGFLVIFRTSQAYTRFWDGCTSMHRMRAEWFDGCSALIAFLQYSHADEELLMNFRNIITRLFSMLHAVALAEIEDSNSNMVEEVEAFKYSLMDPDSIDSESLVAIKESSAKVELVFQWIQCFIVENIDNGVLRIPPPILSRVFQEIANGMVEFHEALKISSIPFPFPYAQTCSALLIIHWLLMPFVMSQWVPHPVWAGVLSFFQVFILWCLHFISLEIENPFGYDANDIDAAFMQDDLNEKLVLLSQPIAMRTPKMAVTNQRARLFALHNSKSFAEVWRSVCSESKPTRSSRATVHSSGVLTQSLYSSGRVESTMSPHADSQISAISRSTNSVTPGKKIWRGDSLRAGPSGRSLEKVSRSTDSVREEDDHVSCTDVERQASSGSSEHSSLSSETPAQEPSQTLPPASARDSSRTRSPESRLAASRRARELAFRPKIETAKEPPEPMADQVLASDAEFSAVMR